MEWMGLILYGASAQSGKLASPKRRNLRRGIAALCLGGGNAVALAVERP